MKKEKYVSVGYGSGEAYVKVAGISIFSLLSNNPDYKFQFYYVENNISQQSKDYLRDIVEKFGSKINFFPVLEVTKDIQETTTFYLTSYARLFIHKICTDDDILFFDCDTLITSTLNQLIEMSMEDKLVAGVQDTVSKTFRDAIGLPADERYINAGGVIKLNLKRWRECGIEKNVLKLIKRFAGDVPFHDQGVLNAVTVSNRIILGPEYNLMSPMLILDSHKIKRIIRSDIFYSDEELARAMAQPKVIHFTADEFGRPWSVNCTHPFKQLYLNYMDKTPWKGQIEKFDLPQNAKIMKYVNEKFPFFIYILLLRIVELKKKIHYSKYWRNKN